MSRKDLFFLLCSLSLILAIKSQTNEDLCSFKNNGLTNIKSINCDPISAVIINQGEEILCISLDNRNGKYANTSIEVEGVRSIGLVNIYKYIITTDIQIT